MIAVQVTFPGGARAWADDGHKIICAIAEELLNGEQRRELRRLVQTYRPGGGSPYRYFTTACTFADLARARSREYEKAIRRRDHRRAEALQVWARFARFDDWHYLNLPRSAQRVAAPLAGHDDVLGAIDEHRARFTDKRLEDWQRAEALILLGHWVGDVHQPLHVSYEDDAGGNDVSRIKGGYYRSADLHAVWDSGIIDKARGERDWLAYARTLRQIPPADRIAWESSSPLDWANESYAVTIEADTDYCERTATTCRWEGRTRTLTRSYQLRFQPVVETRLRQAGARLARLIAAGLD
jgi:hypothetical protein